MSSVYIHIPFCKRRCHYCDFYKELHNPEADSYFTALEREMEYRKDFLGRDKPVSTLYFGGGTPSACHPSKIQAVIEKAHSLWEFSSDPEITIEVNPDDATDEYLEALANTRVNRISFGVQSFADKDLELLNRRHNSAQAIRAIEKARELRFENISIDLIFGIPGMTLQDWEKNVMKAMFLGVDHISTYMLTVEPETKLSDMVYSGEVDMPDDELCEKQYLLAHRILSYACFDHYEVSNYARTQFYRSRHNSNYWSANSYLGLGPAAHSYDGKVRSSAAADLDRYMRESGTESIYTKDILTNDDLYNEYIMISLRTSSGVRRDVIMERFGTDSLLHFEYEIQRFIKQGMIIRTGNEYRIPPEKFMMSDAVIRELFYQETDE